MFRKKSRPIFVLLLLLSFLTDFKTPYFPRMSRLVALVLMHSDTHIKCNINLRIRFQLQLAELRQECDARGLETKGNKGELIARLQAYLEEHGENRISRLCTSS